MTAVVLLCAALEQTDKSSKLEPLLERSTVLCIDPGHPSEVGRGTTGKRVSELEVAWKVAILLRERLVQKGYTVFLTKTAQDVFVSNRARAEYANKVKAAIFLRLHLDASPDPGFATFYPDRKGQTGGFRGPSRWVLEQSGYIAGPFHRAAIRALGSSLSDRGVLPESRTAIGSKQGALTGSIYSHVPVLLVEMAVLTHPHDEAFVASASGQAKLALALHCGLDAALHELRKRRNPAQGDQKQVTRSRLKIRD